MLLTFSHLIWPQVSSSHSATVRVPYGSVPGVTRVVVNYQGKIFASVLPRDAVPRCIMKVTLDGKPLEVSCHVQKRSAPLRALVPGDAIPGVSKTFTCGEPVLEITVPQNAKPGDTMLISSNKRNSQVRSLSLPMAAPSPVDPKQDNQRHETLQRLLKENKGTWNPKIERASTDRLQVPGIVTNERISKGEVLVRCPPELLLSPMAVRQLCPEQAVMVAEAAHQVPFDSANIDLALQATFLASWIAAIENFGSKITIRDPVKQDVWGAFLQVLLCETFAQHPYRLSAQDPAAFKSLLSPSCEADLIEYLSWTVMQWYDVLANSFSAEFSAEQFLRAWLMVTTRAFDVDGTRTTLVPGLDSFNHDPNRHSARAAPDGLGGMLVAATRDIEAGEEVFFTYQQFSISELYRTYGFTLPLEASWQNGNSSLRLFCFHKEKYSNIVEMVAIREASHLPKAKECSVTKPLFDRVENEAMRHQTFTVLPSRVRFLLLKHLPPNHAGRWIEFHSAMLHPTLVAAVKVAQATSVLEYTWFLGF